jgi:hypothetical protein
MHPSPRPCVPPPPQELGISVLRTWFFNLGMPKDFDRYDARQVAGMDYVIWAAKRRGLLLTLTMGNLWNAYRGPEDFLLWATGSLGELWGGGGVVRRGRGGGGGSQETPKNCGNPG